MKAAAGHTWAQAPARGRYGKRSRQRGLRRCRRWTRFADRARCRSRWTRRTVGSWRRRERRRRRWRRTRAATRTTMTGVKERKLRAYVSEPNRGRRKWKGKRDAQKATYANRRRIRGNRQAAGCAARGEKAERPFAYSACAASTFGGRTFENECSSTRRPSTSGSSCASGSALEPPVHCRASLPYKLHSQLRSQPASCAFSPVSGAFPPFLSRISPPHARRPASCTTTPRPRVRFLSQP